MWHDWRSFGWSLSQLGVLYLTHTVTYAELT